ncbi:hypothetical protein MAC_08992 [Metarhizium acridum CQMa 102]|uniref:Endonuclease III n=1 Tax=Metarhizium acridum (strain CQMa 102) TaxID=655827 RepID=E9EGJ4_METAQ|nr:uncharacterized protein MAC_08992 [Metarhizium acridum CQMa 102]EFY84960.1 hypothetical protein MAC_08992 [Metarhizium acridum CQMa 102]
MVQTRKQSREKDEATAADQKAQDEAARNAQSPSKLASHHPLEKNHHRGQKHESGDEMVSDLKSAINNKASDGQGLQQQLHRILNKHKETPLQQLVDEKWPASKIVMVHILNALLSSTRISHHIALATLRCLVDEDYHDLKTLHESSWQERTEILTNGGYTHYRERTATYLGDLADLMRQKYGKILLRQSVRAFLHLCINHANHAYKDDDASKILSATEQGAKLRSILTGRLKEIKGLGPVGCDIFLATVQGFCPNVAPYLDRRNLDMAKKIGLTDDLEAIFEALRSSPMDMARLEEALTSERLDR